MINFKFIYIFMHLIIYDNNFINLKIIVLKKFHYYMNFYEKKLKNFTSYYEAL